MDIQAIEASRDLGGDLLFRVDGMLIRARVTRTTTDDQVRAAVERAVEQVNFKFQCALARDESGDVEEDGTGAHVIFAAEVHGITLEALANGQSLEAWVAGILEDIVTKAQRKAFFMRQIGAKYRLPSAH